MQTSTINNQSQRMNVTVIQRANSQVPQHSQTSSDHLREFYNVQPAVPFETGQSATDFRHKNKMRITTNVSKSEVKMIDDYPQSPEKQAMYKYCCPICLRYFNHILVSSCCKNYICRLCIGLMAKKSKQQKGFVIRCSLCFEEDFKLNDVSPNDEIKHYTDTPFKFKQI